MTFRVGQKVVCVDPRNGAPASNFGAGFDNGLRLNAIYTIAAISGCFVSLAEISTGGWFESRFRPAVERKTDISIFTALLNPSKQTEKA